MQNSKFYTSSTLMAIAACFLWSTAFAGIKIGLKYSPPIQFAGIRFIISGLMVLPFCGAIKPNVSIIIKHWKYVVVISLLQTSLLYSMFYLGVSLIPAAFAAIVVGASPLFIALMAHFITGKDSLNTRKIVALIIGFTGIVLLGLTKETSASGQSKIIIGIALLITGNISGGYSNILISQNQTKMPPLLLNAVQIFIGGIVMLVVSFFIEDFTWSIKPLPYYLSLGWLSILSAAALSIWFVVLSRKEVRVSEINIWKFLIPVFGAVISWIIIPEEAPMWQTITGMLIIASSVLIINMPGIKSFARRIKQRD